MTERSVFDPELPSFDFASLREAGINAMQRLSGDVWTDYNLHDPGVTIFEQLIYALTELDYLSAFPVADHLTGPDGEIDFDRLALRAPDEIFPCRPTTPEDYRLALLEAFPVLEDVQVTADAESSGLYHIDLRSDDVISTDEEAALATKVAAAFYQRRNLGEDLARPPRFIRPQRVNLSGCIGIDPAFDPAAVLADIYLAVQALLIATGKFEPFEIVRQQALVLEDAFSGPMGESGISSSGLGRSIENLPDAMRLRETIEDVAGVRAVDAVSLEPVEEPQSSSSHDWRLRLPRAASEIDVDLIADGVGFEIDGEILLGILNYRLSRNRQDSEQSNAKDAYALPRGRHLRMNDYVPLQEHFPKAYGLGRNRQDVASDPAERSRINQLRGYLVHFDQLLSDFQNNVAHINELFSADVKTGQSYHTAPLDAAAIADLQAVYPDEPDRILAGIRDAFDDFVERKGRIIDYLLALYGETPRPLPGGSTSDARRWLDMRLAMLRKIQTLGRDRAGGLDLAAPAYAHGGYHDRLAALIGMIPGAENDAACDDSDASPGFFVVEHILLRPRTATSRRFDLFYRNRLSLVFAAHQGRNGEEIWRDFVEETVIENTPAHLFADILWLDCGDMVAFKLLFDRWRNALRDDPADPSSADPAAEQLADFLMSKSASLGLAE